MKPKILKTESEYEAALSKVESLMEAEPGSKAEAELELWSLLVENFEREHHAIDLPDPVEAIRFRMEQQGLRPVDLIPFLTSKSRVSEVLGGSRGLTLGMIRALASGLHIPAEVLIREPRTHRKPRNKTRAKDITRNPKRPTTVVA